jgi:hypothetical protein
VIPNREVSDDTTNHTADERYGWRKYDADAAWSIVTGCAEIGVYEPDAGDNDTHSRPDETRAIAVGLVPSLELKYLGPWKNQSRVRVRLRKKPQCIRRGPKETPDDTVILSGPCYS